MIIQNVIISTTHLKPEEIFQSEEGFPSPALDQLIRTIENFRRQNKNPILVIGSAGDEILRYCPLAETCELIFDPNYTGDLFSSMKAGLHICEAGAYFLPQLLEVDLKPQLFREIENIAFQMRDEKVDILCPVADSAHKTLPLVVTAHGVRHLMSLTADTKWEETSKIQRREVAITT